MPRSVKQHSRTSGLEAQADGRGIRTPHHKSRGNGEKTGEKLDSPPHGLDLKAYRRTASRNEYTFNSLFD
jgi:hypothetical protein